MNTQELWEIPDSWVWTRLSALGDVVSGGTPSTKNPEYWGSEVNWISPSDLTDYDSKRISRGAKGLSTLGLESSSAKLMPAGSVHFSSRAPIGYVVISAEPLATNQGFKSLVPADGVFNEYIYYYLKAAKPLAERRASGTTFLEISGSAFGKLPIPLAPMSQQRRIVSKLDELLSELENGTETLRLARQQLKAYRLALLKSAFEGRLTASWRRERTDTLPTPEQLLATVTEAQTASHQQHLEDWRSKVKEWEENGSRGRKPSRPRAPADPQLRSDGDLPELPSGWVWISVSSLGGIETGTTPSTKNRDYYGGEIPFFKPTDLEAGHNVGEARDHLTDLGLQTARPLPENSILVTCIGATIGKTGIIRCPGASNQQINSIIPTTAFDPDFIYFQVIAPFFQNQIQSNYSSTTLPILNKTKFSELSFAICSREEQRLIAEELQRQLSAVDKVFDDLDVQVNKAESLRLSILKKAFAGELVPQEPTQESASVLLERIAAGKNDHKITRKKRKTGT